MSAYRVAIDQTAQTIDRRAKCYRNLIAVVVVISLCSIGAALVEWTLWPLIGFLLLYPICGLYFFFDGEILNSWRSQLFANWKKRELDFWGFRDAMRAIPNLPKATLQSMVETLPSSPNWDMERAASERTREMLSLVVIALHKRHANTALMKATASALVAVFVILILLLQVWYLILFLAVIMPLPLIAGWLKWRGLRKLRTIIIAAYGDPEFNGEVFVSLLNHLDWSGLSPSSKAAMIGAISSPAPVTPMGNNREQTAI